MYLVAWETVSSLVLLNELNIAQLVRLHVVESICAGSSPRLVVGAHFFLDLFQGFWRYIGSVRTTFRRSKECSTNGYIHEHKATSMLPTY